MLARDACTAERERVVAAGTGVAPGDAEDVAAVLPAACAAVNEAAVPAVAFPTASVPLPTAPDPAAAEAGATVCGDGVVPVRTMAARVSVGVVGTEPGDAPDMRVGAAGRVLPKAGNEILGTPGAPAKLAPSNAM